MKVLAIIQARTGSTRLPNKVLIKIQEKPILHLIIEFLKFCKLIDKIVVATTDLHEDDKIEYLCRELKIDCFRGSPTDVLKRYYDCAKMYNGELIIRITADDPLLDPEIVDQVIRTCIKTKCDFASTSIGNKFPIGYFIEAVTFSTLEKLYRTQNDPLTREHVTYYIKQNLNSFNVQQINPPSGLSRPTWRLTLDYSEDLLLFSKIFDLLYKQNSFINYSDRKSTRLNSSHSQQSRMPSSA